MLWMLWGLYKGFYSILCRVTSGCRLGWWEECTIQFCEDMLRAFVIYFKGNLDDQLPLIEFWYNSKYHLSIGMSPFEAFYGTVVDL